MTDRPSRGRRATAGWTSSGLVIGGLAVVALALLVVPGWIAPQPTPAPVSGSASPGVIVSFPPSAFRSVEWQVSSMGAGSEGAAVTGLTVAGERLVAVGVRDEQPLAWWSDDGGSTWSAAQPLQSPVPSEGQGAIIGPVQLAAAGSLVVATGVRVNPETHELLGPVVWVSPDGRTWQAHDLSGAMPGSALQEIVGTGDGFYATGHASSALDRLWWQSPDGIRWVPLTVAGSPGMNIGIRAVAWTPDLVVATGSSGANPTLHPAIWAANELRQFEQVFSDEKGWGEIRAVAAADYGFVAVGRTVDTPDDEAQTHLAVWVSANGRAWMPLALRAPLGSAAGAVAANAAGAAVLGASPSGGQRAEAWFLPGGSGTPSVVSLPMAARSIVALSDRFVVVGLCPPDDGCAGPMVAIGRPSEASEVPAPTLPPAPVERR